jgi:hypothetical protein
MLKSGQWRVAPAEAGDVSARVQFEDQTGVVRYGTGERFR